MEADTEVLPVRTWHPLDGLDHRGERGGLQLDPGIPTTGVWDALPPIGVVSVDLARDEPPAPAGELNVRRRRLWVLVALLLLALRDFELPVAVVVKFLPLEEFVDGHG